MFDDEDLLQEDPLDDLSPLSEADRVVWGNDDRFRISARRRRRPSTLLHPTNTICLLELADRRGRRWWPLCTGTLIAPQIVLTARHCLPGVRRVRVTPGADREASGRLRRPFGSRTAPSTRFRNHPTLDLALIFLPTPFRRPSRFMTLQTRSARGSRTRTTLAGYPRDKRHGTMWGGSETVRRVTPRALHYRIDTAIGQSGAPVWLLGNNGTRLLLAVHRGANGASNDGTRISCEVVEWIRREARRARVRGPRVDRVAYRRKCSSGRRLNDSSP